MVKHPKYRITFDDSFGTYESKTDVSCFGSLPFVSIKRTSTKENTRSL
jgi:hypothetical protein